jgi:hypothetical protein
LGGDKVKPLSLVLLIVFISGCSSTHKSINGGARQVSGELLEFAKANCFFWHFKKKGYDLEDISAISGGIVEMGSYSADQYQQVSLMVRNYSPAVETKQNIDVDLLKCFTLDSDPDFIRLLGKIE